MWAGWILCGMPAALAVLSPWRRPAALACAIGCAMALLAAPVALTLPGGVALGVDGLSAFALAVLFAGGGVCCLAAAPVLAPLLVAALAWVMLAQDGVALLLAEAASVALVAALPGMSRHTLRPLLLGWLALAGTLAVMAAGLGDAGFAAWRAAPSAGPAALALALACGAGHALPGRAVSAHRALAGGEAGLLAGPLALTGIYIAARLVLDLDGHAMPLWWAWPLLLIGSVSALSGAWRAVAVADDALVLLAASTVARQGLVWIGLGLAVAMRAADQPAAATLALAAAVLQTLVNGLASPLACLAAGAMQSATGTRHLRRMGGLARRMSVTSSCLAAALTGLAVTPPGAAFPAAALLLASLTAAPRLGGVLWQMPLLVVALTVGVTLALEAAAALRLGVALLAGPRTPRAAAAQEVEPALRIGMASLAALTLLTGLFPAGPLALAGAALRRLGGDPSTMTGLTAIVVVPPLLLALALAAALLLRWARPIARRAPGWREGAPPAPAWLPFGDPATWVGADPAALLRSRLAALRPPIPTPRRRPPAPARTVDLPGAILVACIAALLAALAFR